jgi:hypothetical protein
MTKKIEKFLVREEKSFIRSTTGRGGLGGGVMILGDAMTPF